MKAKWMFPMLFGICLTKISLGQVIEVDTMPVRQPNPVVRKEFTIGLDIFKNIPYPLFGNNIPIPTSESARLHNRGIAEIILRKQARDKMYWVGLVGISKVEISDPEGIERRQEITGLYGKGGAEWALGQKKGHSKFGIRGMLTYCQSISELVYEGPAFGDYRSTRVVNNFGIGFEPYYAFDFFLGPSWVLRWETRWSHHQRVVGKGFTPYYPGAGVSFGYYNFVVSGGTTLQLHYRFRPER